jgi:hypothetical protein
MVYFFTNLVIIMKVKIVECGLLNGELSVRACLAGRQAESRTCEGFYRRDAKTERSHCEGVFHDRSNLLGAFSFIFTAKCAKFYAEERKAFFIPFFFLDEKETKNLLGSIILNSLF